MVNLPQTAPAPLRDMPNWVVYRLEKHPNEDRQEKIPHWADGTQRFGTQGGPEDRARLVTFEVAREAAIRMGFDGVGFAHTEGCGIVTLDFDKCVGPDGKVRQDVLDLVTMTYAEYSPSGKGIHAIFIGDADILGNQKANVSEGLDFSVEAFSSKLFTTFTGNTLDYVDVLYGADYLAPLPDITIAACQKRFGPQKAKDDPDDFMIGHEPKTGLSVSQMEGMLAVLDPDMSREDWIKPGMGLHHETDGDDTGFEIWNDWSAKGSKYPGEEELRKQWDSFDRRKSSGQANITMRTVKKMAKEAGYQDPGIDISAVQPADVPKVDATPSHPLLDPFPGFMADVVYLALATAHKRQPAMTLLGVLVAMASACGSKIYLPDGMRLNLYGLCAAPTGSGKDHILHVTGEIARAAGARRLGEFASGAGLEDALCEGGIFASIDEIAHVLSVRGDNGGQHVREVEKMLLKLFSASKADYHTRVKAGTASRCVANPSLNLMGFAVPSKLGEALTEGDIASGLLNRMLIAVGDGAARPQPGLREKFELDATMISKLEALRFASGAITFSAEAEQRVEELNVELYDAEQRLPEEAPERLLLSRKLEKTLRIAGVLSVFDLPGSPQIKIAHLDWAINFVEVSDGMLLQFIERHMHGGKVQANAAKVKDIARSLLLTRPEKCRPTEAHALAKGYAPVSLVAKRCHLNVSDMKDAIAQLEMCGDMQKTTFAHAPTHGRGGKCDVIYFPNDL
ncbi:PriCT-2 domain-containing protein [Sphingorhabdus wooponensis]|uniref:DUF3987 domain-containing protein n=1 Tax=Sphingorhabdus wooponensis TaxID=940136 RepID=A0A3R8WKV2_9SPHN|nr:PriCT-2 domain-containing protein [Sphingorhabdus wooponensis]RRQ52278.1 DUF3987 domain-containing protein [Sphingorhabdus wooponensis]